MEIKQILKIIHWIILFLSVTFSSIILYYEFELLVETIILKGLATLVLLLVGIVIFYDNNITSLNE